MKTREEVIALFRGKYEYLKEVCQQQIGPFKESAIFQNPDGGWQLNIEQPLVNHKAAITLRPNDEEPHETHGVIGARWFHEGGVFDNNGFPGWLGYPVADEERRKATVNLPSYSYLPIERIHSMINSGPISSFSYVRDGYVSIWKACGKVPHATSQFEFGGIEIFDGLTWEQATEELNYNTLSGLLPILEEYSSPPAIPLAPPFAGDIPCISSAAPWPSSDILDMLKTAVKERHMNGTDLAALFGNSSDSVFAIPPNMSVSLNESGKRHVPKDIENSVETILITHGFHVVGGRSWFCDFYHHLYHGLRWMFRAEVEKFNHFSILVWREGTDIHATINARSKSIFGDYIEKELVIPNHFKVA